MSSASSPVRRPAAAAPNVVSAAARSPTAQSAAPAARSHGTLDAADIPPLDTNLDIEGLKPTLLSRLLDLFAPKR